MTIAGDSADAAAGPVLAIDTSTRLGVLVLFDPESGSRFSGRLDPATTHGRDLVPAIRELVESAGVRFDALGRIAVGIGPGSYTGLRVGVAIAKTLADVLAVPILPVDSLLLSVLGMPESSQANCCVAVADAQRGAVYESVYERANTSESWSRTSGPVIRPWTDLRRWSESANDCILTGPGLSLAAKLGDLGAATTSADRWNPTAEAMFRWIDRYADRTAPVPIDALEPLYIRPSAAEEKLALASSGRSD
jgi:tRNA threonylcarbamoyladenosine biosynthesis protein TsaB